MLWYKSWLETRSRFIIGLVLLICSAVVVIVTYPFVVTRLADAIDPATIPVSGALGDQIREGLTIVREYRGYVWWQWFRMNFRDTWTIFAVLLGTGGLLSQAAGGAALFTLSMPASRRRLLGVRAGTALAELGVLAIVPALLMPLLSPAIGQSYSPTDALVHGICLFLSGAVFFSLAFLLSTVFTDVWRPAVIAVAFYYGVSFVEQASRGLWGRGLMSVMSAESYFRAGQLPWLGLLVTVGLSLAMLYGAVVNIERKDF
jgi:ABC-2 type transport system permease protein